MVMRVERKNHRHVFQMRAGVTVRWDQVAGRVIGRLEGEGMGVGVDMGACMYAQVTCKRASY